jgi:hypothetical protein
MCPFATRKILNKHIRNANFCDLNILHTPRICPPVIFLFGYLHAKVKLLSYETMNELEEAITKTIEGIPKGTLIGVSHAWR